MTHIPLADAIRQLRDELRLAILEGHDQDIVLTPNSVDIELSIKFGVEATASGGIKVLTFLDISGQSQSDIGKEHKIRLSLSITDPHGQPIKLHSEANHRGLNE